MDRGTIVKVLKRYTLESSISHIKELNPRVAKVTLCNGRKFIIKNSDYDRIKRQYEVLVSLKSSNVLVAPILEAMDGRPYVKTKDGYYYLFPFIEGDCRKDLYVDNGEKIISSYGYSIAELHRGLRQVNISEDFSCDTFIKNIFNVGLKYIYIYENKNIISDVESIIHQCYNFKSIGEKLPTQMIHGDLHTGNIIYVNKKVNAFIDFEGCYTGYRVYDLCFLMRDILNKKFKGKSDSQGLNLCNKLIKSYNKHAALTEYEYKAIWYGLLFSQFLVTGYLYDNKSFEVARRYLKEFFLIYENKDAINESLMR